MECKLSCWFIDGFALRWAFVVVEGVVAQIVGSGGPARVVDDLLAGGGPVNSVMSYCWGGGQVGREVEGGFSMGCDGFPGWVKGGQLEGWWRVVSPVLLFPLCGGGVESGFSVGDSSRCVL